MILVPISLAAGLLLGPSLLRWTRRASRSRLEDVEQRLSYAGIVLAALATGFLLWRSYPVAYARILLVVMAVLSLIVLIPAARRSKEGGGPTRATVQWTAAVLAGGLFLMEAALAAAAAGWPPVQWPRLLVSAAGPRALPALAAGARHPRAEVRIAALEVLADLANTQVDRETGKRPLPPAGLDQVVPAMIAAAGDSDVQVRRVAVKLFTGVRDPRIGEALAGLLSDPDQQVRTDAISAVRVQRDAATVAPLLLALTDTHGVTVDQATFLNYFSGLSTWATPELLRALQSSDPRLRLGAVYAASRTPGDELFAALLKATEDPSAEVRAAAAGSLGEVTWNQRNQQALELSSLRSTRPVYSSASGISFDAQEVVDRLTASLRDPDRRVRQAAVQALPRAAQRRFQVNGEAFDSRAPGSRMQPVDTRKAVSELARLLRDPDSVIRRAAVKALLQCDATPAIVPDLVRAAAGLDRPALLDAAQLLLRLRDRRGVPVVEAVHDLLYIPGVPCHACAGLDAMGGQPQHPFTPGVVE